MPNGELLQELQKMVESGDIPSQVSNRLILAGIIQNFNQTRDNAEMLDTVNTEQQTQQAELDLYKKINWLIIAVIIGEAIAIIITK